MDVKLKRAARLGLSFSRRRIVVFAALMTTALVFLFLAISASMTIAAGVPPLAAVLFIGGLMAWYVPALCLSWIPVFTFTEFGAMPNGWPGIAVTILFYAIPSAIVAFVRIRR